MTAPDARRRAQEALWMFRDRGERTNSSHFCQLVWELADAMGALLAEPAPAVEEPETPRYVCTKCSRIVSAVVHEGCNYHAAPILRNALRQLAAIESPAPAALDEGVREAAETVCERLVGTGGDYYREIAPGLMSDIEALKAALGSALGAKR